MIMSEQYTENSNIQENTNTFVNNGEYELAITNDMAEEKYDKITEEAVFDTLNRIYALRGQIFASIDTKDGSNVNKKAGKLAEKYFGKGTILAYAKADYIMTERNDDKIHVSFMNATEYIELLTDKKKIGIDDDIEELADKYFKAKEEHQSIEAIITMIKIRYIKGINKIVIERANLPMKDLLLVIEANNNSRAETLIRLNKHLKWVELWQSSSL